MPVIPVAQRQKQDIPYSHKYLVSFPFNPYSTPNILMTQHNVSIYSNFKANLKTIFPGCHVPWGPLQQGPGDVKKGENQDVKEYR